MNSNILEFNHQGRHGKHPFDDFTCLSKVTNTTVCSGNSEVSASPSLSIPDDQPKSTSNGKNLGKMKCKSASAGKDKPKRRRNLSGYNFYMKYHRTVTVSTGMTLDILDDSLTHEEKLRHVLEVLERDPYRLQSGQKRRHRKSHGAIGFKELTIQVASSWRNLDVSAKSVFEDIARQAKNQKRENDSSADSRCSSFDIQPAAQGSNMHSVLEEALFSTGTGGTGAMPSLAPPFQSDGSTPSVTTTGTASAGFVAAAPPSSLQHPIIGANLSASSLATDASATTTCNTVESHSMCDDLFEPAPLSVTSQVPIVAGASSSFNGSYNSFSASELSEGRCPNGSSNNNSNSNELASFLSRLDWSQL